MNDYEKTRKECEGLLNKNAMVAFAALAGGIILQCICFKKAWWAGYWQRHNFGMDYIHNNESLEEAFLNQED